MWHHRNMRKGCRGFILLPGSSPSLFSQDKRSACSPCLTIGDTEVPLRPLKSALPCLLPQLRAAALILTEKADDSLKNEGKKEVTFREASLSTSLPQRVQAGTSPSPDMAQSDLSSHKRIAGPGPGLSLDTRYPLPRYILTL